VINSLLCNTLHEKASAVQGLQSIPRVTAPTKAFATGGLTTWEQSSGSSSVEIDTVIYTAVIPRV